MTQIKQRGSVARRSAVTVILRHVVPLFMLGSLAGCAGGLGRTFTVQFAPFAATPNEQGRAAVQAAIAFAKANPLDPIALDGFHYGQYANQFDTISEQRVRAVEALLVDAGINGARIGIRGEGMAFAQGTPMPSLPRDTVQISIGL